MSDLYTYAAHVSGLPRKEAKLAIIKMIYGKRDEDNPDWVVIRTAMMNAPVED